MAEKRLADATDPVKNKLEDLMKLLDSVIDSVKNISYELRPSLLDELGLAATMEWHLNEIEKRIGLQFSFNEPEEELPLSEEVRTGLFLIFQESLTNIVRHAEANRVMVTFQQREGELQLRIEDNGKGFDVSEHKGKKRWAFWV